MTATKRDGNEVRIDPRIQERRKKVARSQARKRLYLIVAVLVVIGGYFMVRALLRTSMFSVRKIQITGSSHYSNAALIAQSGIQIGFPLTQVNPELVGQRMEQLPWNGPVKVRKSWPNTLDITIQNRTAVAVIPNNATSDLIVDSSGRVLGLQVSSNAKLVSLCLMSDIPSSKALTTGTGCEFQSTRPGSLVSASFAPLLKVANYLRGIAGANFSKLAVSNSGEIDGELASGVAVRFGSANQLNQKIRAVQLLLAQASIAGYTTMDVRAPLEPVLSNW
ncbi:MAG: FtsQ-type POTRA domain-containing protein [Acidimicrobiaceae bacterium]|nr:FtsQ-type POTRA domain-containing protein [Acidimicrobiaceae bacterium]